jgi:hypothetical protein
MPYSGIIMSGIWRHFFILIVVPAVAYSDVIKGNGYGMARFIDSLYVIVHGVAKKGSKS